MEEKKRKLNWKTVVIIILATMLAIVVGLEIRIFLWVPEGIKYKSYEYIQLEEKVLIDGIMTKGEIKSALSSQLTSFYIYEEIDSFVDPYNYGGTQVLFRRVVVRDDLSHEDYARVMAHELTHLKHVTGNEFYVAYKSITYLLESPYEYLQGVGWNFAAEILRGEWVGTDYDCGYYLTQYLMEKSLI